MGPGGRVRRAHDTGGDAGVEAPESRLVYAITKFTQERLT